MYGHYELVVIPFHLTNAPTAFMCLINIVLHPYLEKFFILFIDDILVYSRNEEEHVEHLVAVLKFLREHKLYAKHSKCNLFQSEVHYLGHAISKEGIVVDPEMIRAIMEWVAPKNVDKVRPFMGLGGYYKRFIRKLTHITYPITSLQRKGKKFKWIEECEASFEQLKQFLTHAPMLKIVDLDKEFVVCKNAYMRGIGGFLM